LYLVVNSVERNISTVTVRISKVYNDTDVGIVTIALFGQATYPGEDALAALSLLLLSSTLTCVKQSH
jgi:hypothetical protein